MAALEALKFLIEDHGDINPLSGFRKTFAEDDPYMSLLQRSGKTLDEVLGLFEWDSDDTAWRKEYAKENNDCDKLVKFRRCVYFDICGWRELNEDFGRGDVSCLRDIRTPLVTSRTPLKAAKDEFK